MDFNYFDIVVLVIVLFLGFKGIINGFFKELFGLVGIVGGIFLASRVGDSVGQVLSDIIFKFQSSSAISFSGFLFTIVLFWLLMLGAGMALKKLSFVSGLGAFDKILGFFFSASKFFFIASVIIYSAYNVKATRTTLDSFMKNSILFPAMVTTGSYIMKLEPLDIEKAVDEKAEEEQNKINKTIDNSTLKIVEDAKSKIKEKAVQNLNSKGEK
ncbi:CvpA family protein [Sulfurimonas sp.]|uniref:CvpA family protein n=1 Tax=Sulfurimonas sp. TaxID=2022749 RepID=UPI0025DD6D8A|nr:CvpA family protein [Sulfurimonas sp.]MDD5156726.1 CvpA family protein [Sulfurimonas sp.]